MKGGPPIKVAELIVYPTCQEEVRRQPATALGWFCDAYASWQKGAVENANGRLRRDLPRDLDLDALSDAELQEIVLSHNLTPRKCLGFLTPVQALLKELGRDVQIRFA